MLLTRFTQIEVTYMYLISDYYEDNANVYVPPINRPRNSDVHLGSENKNTLFHECFEKCN